MKKRNLKWLSTLYAFDQQFEKEIEGQPERVARFLRGIKSRILLKIEEPEVKGQPFPSPKIDPEGYRAAIRVPFGVGELARLERCCREEFQTKTLVLETLIRDDRIEKVSKQARWKKDYSLLFISPSARDLLVAKVGRGKAGRSAHAALMAWVEEKERDAGVGTVDKKASNA